MTIRVVIVDDSPTMRAILMNRLGKEADIEVVAAAANAAEGRQMIRELDPDVVTLDIEMPGMNGLDFLAKIMELRPTPFTEALLAVQAGERVLVLIDEVKRVADPGILNPLMLLLAQGEYHSVVTKDVFRVTRENFVMFTTANDAQGYSFAGNTRRGVDDAFDERFSRIEMHLPPQQFIPEIVQSRVPDATPEMCETVGMVYGLAQGAKDTAQDAADTAEKAASDSDKK